MIKTNCHTNNFFKNYVFKLKIFFFRHIILFFSLVLFLPWIGTPNENYSKSSNKSFDHSEFSYLWNQAIKVHLYNDPYWLKLLHYYSFGESIGQWSFKSDVVSRRFFLSSKGKNDPKEELKETLKALISKQIGEPDQHARCRFIARFEWLKSKLIFPKLQKHDCPLFDRWANLNELSGISLVYVSSYLKNPASTFGHLLLKFNSNDRFFGHSLLRPTMNFGAKINPEDNPLVYALKGLFGGYKGIFSDERFYNFNHVYGENELRDLWEYPLRFSKDQQHRVIFHAWELLHNVEFTYYFFLDNCAYRMAELLELAWDSDKRINTSGAMWAIPIDVLFKLEKIKIDNKRQSMVGDPNLIFSRQKKLQYRVSLLNEKELFQLRLLIDDYSLLDSDEFKVFEDTSKAKIIDALIDYQQYLNNDEINSEQKKMRDNLLQFRSKLPVIGEIQPNEIPKSPIHGTPPMRFRIGTVLNGSYGTAIEIGAWANYHDLLGDEKGHIKNAEVVTLDLKMQLRETFFDVTHFQLFNIQKYALNPTGVPGDFEWSWRAKAIWERENYTCFPCRIFRTSGGFGRAISLTNRDLEYIFLDMFLETPEDSFSSNAYGLAPHLGMTWSPLDLWKIKIEIGLFKGIYGLKKEYLRGIFAQRLSISQNFDVRFELEHFMDLESSLALHYYW